MKNLLKIILLLSSLMIVGGLSGCSGDGGGEPTPKGSEKVTDANGIVTLKIQENANGFVSSTGTVKTEFAGYSGSGYLDNLTEGGTVFYTVSAEEDINDAKIAIHYLNTETTRIRSAYVTVNGTLLNENSPLAMLTEKKVKKDSSSASDWKDTVYVENIYLKKGSNSIKLEGAPIGTYTALGGETLNITDAGCMAYVDYLIVVGKGIDYGTDTTKYLALNYASENEVAGSVSSETAAGSIAEGSSITLKASANSEWEFECWSDGTTENPYTFTLTKATTLFAHFKPKDYASPNGLVGYATVTSDDGASYTITGGAGASAENIFSISSYDELVNKKDILSSDIPKIITIIGTISTASNANPLLSEKYTIGSNSSIYGDLTNQGRLKNIEFIVEGANVIIRNMMFGEVISWDGYTKSGADDALSLNKATHVWVDHCEFQSHLTPQDLNGTEITSSSSGIAGSYYSNTEKWQKDFYDGLLDIKNGSTWITISNCYIHDHYKACLCASGDNGPDNNTLTGANDSDMRVTFYNNYWKNVNARQPMFRYGKFHVFDSYFDAGTQSGGATCINVRAGATALVEGNYFTGMKSDEYTVGFYYGDDSTKYGNTSGKWTTKNNTGKSNENNTTYTPPYTYTSTKVTSVPVPGTNVGVGVLTSSDLQ